ncbi:Lysine histidine transporter-like 5 [Citrus sinensis]|uniref:Lysine histidine transporter-like 5 n=2 Tax=Citrus sinensis TaxID=2711 RepID=A0ACB8M7E4_CITSI|nr:Lysine histidine transporter-like 5 [Citrus sinensis]
MGQNPSSIFALGFMGIEQTQGKDLNDWLPITASRKAKWWYSAFHNVTAMVGAGVLGLPFAFSQLGWGAGFAAIFGSWAITFYSLWQLVELHEVVPGKRFDRYPELGEHCFGPRFGYWFVMPQQMLVQIATDIVYMVTGGKSLMKFVELLDHNVENVRLTYFILIFACLHLVLSQTPNFNSLKGVSLLAAVMSICYSMVAFITSIKKGIHHRPESYGVRSHTEVGKAFDFLNGLGTVAFAFAGHSVVLEIQATIPSTPEVPSKKPMWKGVVIAYVIVAFCYLSVGISGYWAFGQYVEDDVLISLRKPAWLIAIANFMVFFHVVGSYQVFAMPVFDMIESYLVQHMRFTPGLLLRLVARSSYVAITGFIAMLLPFFGGLLGFFGGLVFSSTSYFLPCIMWLIVKKPRWWSFHWFACWISIIVGVGIAILAPIGGMRQIIISSKSYKMFS